MIGGHHSHTAVPIKPPPQLGDLFIGLEKGLGGKGPQCADDFGLDDLELFIEERLTGNDLVSLRISIMGRSTFNDIGNIYLFPAETNGVDDPS